MPNNSTFRSHDAVQAIAESIFRALRHELGQVETKWNIRIKALERSVNNTLRSGSKADDAASEAKTAASAATSAATNASNAASRAEAAATSANSAATSATNAASMANTAASSVNTAITSANNATSNANTAASKASTVANQLSNVDMEVAMLPPSSGPTAEVEKTTSTLTTFKLGIPFSSLAYATFEVVNETMELLMHSPDGYDDISFALSDGELEVVI